MKIYQGRNIRYVNSKGQNHKIGMPSMKSLLGLTYEFNNKFHRLNGKSRTQHFIYRGTDYKIEYQGSENECYLYDKKICLSIYRLVI